MLNSFFWLPLSLILLIVWLLLEQHISGASVFLGFALSVVFAMLSLRMRPDLAYPRRYLNGIKLIFLVLIDMLSSNMHTIKLLFKRGCQPPATFVNIPLKLRDPHALSFLACIITFTPGTVWCGLNEDDYILRLHVLDSRQSNEVIAMICDQYEKLLMEIFE
ncbi:Na+/H+ antiporter subunit E [Brackiella oedipodis]|uniref:Na+/H+ antiporter subunit E n=1 Tax=Brackiella oedipodis TaxID=124225 RepID=UPI00048B08FD|nr:Na+/H+ antiporter subunit E [Brackiella oedipodis]